MSEFLSFLGLNNIPLYVYALVNIPLYVYALVIRPCVDGYLGCFLLASANNVNIGVYNT